MYKIYISTYGGSFNDHFQFDGVVNNINSVCKIIDASHMSAEADEILKGIENEYVFSKHAEARGGTSRILVRPANA